MHLDVHRDTDRRKFYAVKDGKTSTLDYERTDDSRLDFKSTFVPEEQRNRGIGSELVRQALEHARNEGYTVVPSCPLVVSYVESHPQLADVAAS